MNIRRFILSAATLFVGTTLVAQTLSLQECIRIGLARNLTVQSAHIDIVKSETAIRESRAKLLPTVNASLQIADYLKEPVNVTTGTLLGNDFPDPLTWQKVHSMPWQSSAMLSLQIPLWNETIHAAIEAARGVKELRHISYEKAREELTVQIARVYYLAQGSKAQAALLGSDIERMKELQSIAGALLEQGVSLEVDYQRIGINITGLEAKQSQMEMLHQQQLNTLRFLLDYDEETEIEVEPQEHHIYKVSTDGLSPSLPDELLASARRSLIDKQRRIVSKGYLPSVALFGQAGYMGYQEKPQEFFQRHDSHWFGTAVIGLQLSIPLFDANQKRLKIRQYNYEAEQAALTQQLIRRKNEKEYANASLQLTQNERIYKAQSDSRQQARDVYDLTAMRYREGVASMTELLQDDMRLTDAEQQVVNALTQWHLAHVELMRLENRLDELE